MQRSARPQPPRASSPLPARPAAAAEGDRASGAGTRRAPRRSPLRVWRRGREIVREQGVRALCFLVLADLGYRRVLLLSCALDPPLPQLAPGVAIAVSRLEPAQLDEYLRFHDEDSRAALESRLARGDECYVARAGGRIVSASWVSRGAHVIRYLRFRYVPARGEAYLYDAYTDPAWRGRGIAPALASHVLAELRSSGLARVTVAITPENRANRRAREKTGFRVCGRIVCLSLGGRVWHWRSDAAARGTARAAQ